MVRSLPLFLLFYTLHSSTVFSQHKSFEMGLKLINEFDYRIYEVGIGPQIVYRLSNHSGIESGLYFKVDAFSYIYGSQFIYGNARTKERNILLPLLYRFDSKPINFTAGSVLKYFTGWSSVDKIPVDDFKYDQHKFEVMASISVSKNFYLKKNLILEPEFRGSAFVPRGGGGFSGNISLRKIIR